MRILICGSRKVKITEDDISSVFNQLSLHIGAVGIIRGVPADMIVESIISGNAYGPDKVAIKWANRPQHMVGISIHWPLWKKYGKSAGIIRDKEMVEECDMCIGFWDGVSKGTKFTLDYAKKKGRKTYVVDCTKYGVSKIREHDPEYTSKW
jgi:hypothetical protein